MKLLDSATKFIKELPHDLRALKARLTDPESASGYKYVFHMQIEDFFAAMAGLVGLTAVIMPGGQGFGLAALAVAGTIGAVRYPSPSKRAAQEISDTSASGQELTGTRGDLFRLQHAQRQISALTKPFNSVAALPDTVAQRVQKITAKTSAERGRVKTGDGKPYEFVRKRVITTLEKV